MLRQAREGAGLSPLAVVSQAMPQQPLSASVKLSEAVGIYQRLKGQGKSETFLRATERSCGYVIDAVKDKDITAYTRADANRFRDALIERGLVGSSITRIVGTAMAVLVSWASVSTPPSLACTMIAPLVSKIVNLCRWTSCKSCRPCAAILTARIQEAGASEPKPIVFEGRFRSDAIGRSAGITPRVRSL
jgi:hypothetical protein